MAIKAQYPSTQAAKSNGWYSRRHKTDEQCRENKTNNARKARREQRRQAAAARATVSATKTPRQRLVLLDHRLGKSQGAVKERARLEAMLKQ